MLLLQADEGGIERKTSIRSSVMTLWRRTIIMDKLVTSMDQIPEAEQPWFCRVCFHAHPVPVLARDCETKHGYDKKHALPPPR